MVKASGRFASMNPQSGTHGVNYMWVGNPGTDEVLAVLLTENSISDYAVILKYWHKSNKISCLCGRCAYDKRKVFTVLHLAIVDRDTHCILSWDVVVHRIAGAQQACLERATQVKQYYRGGFPSITSPVLWSFLRNAKR